MDKRIIFVLFGLALLAYGCSEERESAPLTPEPQVELGLDTEALAWALVSKAGWPVDEEHMQSDPRGESQGLQRHWFHMDREVLIDDIVHYSFQIPVGPGEHDGRLCRGRGKGIGFHAGIREKDHFKGD